MNLLKYRPLLLSLLSALLLSLPWMMDYNLTIYVGFVPLLIMHNDKTKRLLWWVLLTFFLWISATCWWVAMATPLALVMVPLVGLFFMFTPFALFVKLSKGSSEAVKWTLFVTLWIAFEALYTYNDISFPWLTLGNSFTSKGAQWFSLTGVFGGSLLVLLTNITAFKYLVDIKSRSIGGSKVLRANKWMVILLLLVFVPMIGSKIMYECYDETKNPIEVAVIQPNIDPYSEKFGGLSNAQQVDIMLSLMADAPKGTKYFVLPETAIEDQLWLHGMNRSRSIDTMRKFLKANYPNAEIVTGATTLRHMETGEYDYNSYKFDGGRFQVYNSALWVDTSSVIDVYHKSKLVCGVEMIAYPAVFQFLDDVFKVDLGGLGGKNGRSKQREVYDGVGTAICYEGIYGEFFGAYIRRGAEIMFIISNDGWWGDTPGYKHLLRYAKHRAIECRRDIARSANTGISAIINQRGDVVDSLGWDQRGIVVGEVNANKEITFYVNNGDYIVRISLYVLALTLIYILGFKFYKKNNSNR